MAVLEDPPLRMSVDSLVLEPPSESHRQRAVEVLGASDAIAQWTTIPFPYGDSDYDDYLAMDPPKYMILEDGRLLGSVGGTVDKEASTAMVGYWLTPEARGRGVATRAFHALCSALFDVGYQRLEAEVIIGNPTSARVLERAGFSLEGVLRSVHAAACGIGQDRIDLQSWSLLPGELVDL